MRWFGWKERIYNLGQIKAFEVRQEGIKRFQVLAVYSFEIDHPLVREKVILDRFDSNEDAEQCIAEILQGVHDLPVAFERQRPYLEPKST